MTDNTVIGPEHSTPTRSRDGQLLFWVNTLSKMKQGTRLARAGAISATVGGKTRAVKYGADTELCDTEQVPLLELGGTDARIDRRRSIRVREQLDQSVIPAKAGIHRPYNHPTSHSRQSGNP